MDEKFFYHQEDVINIQLTAFLYGPGESDKPAILNLLIEFASDFCELLVLQSNKHTIVITAMSGVAATLIDG